MAKTDYSKWSLEDLKKERESLASQRTEIRLKQVEVEGHIQIAEALEQVPENLRAGVLHKMNTGGEIKSEGAQS